MKESKRGLILEELFQKARGIFSNETLKIIPRCSENNVTNELVLVLTRIEGDNHPTGGYPSLCSDLQNILSSDQVQKKTLPLKKTTTMPQKLSPVKFPIMHFLFCLVTQNSEFPYVLCICFCSHITTNCRFHGFVQVVIARPAFAYGHFFFIRVESSVEREKIWTWYGGWCVNYTKLYKSLYCWRSNWVCQAIYWVLYTLKWTSLIGQPAHSNTIQLTVIERIYTWKIIASELCFYLYKIFLLAAHIL